MNSGLERIATASQEGPGREAPVRAIIRQNREEGVEAREPVDLPVGWLAGLLLAAAVSAAVAAWINARARRTADPLRAAESRLARGLRLSRRGRALLAEVSGKTGVPRLAMLASARAMRSALDALDRAEWSRRPGFAELEGLAGEG